MSANDTGCPRGWDWPTMGPRWQSTARHGGDVDVDRRIPRSVLFGRKLSFMLSELAVRCAFGWIMKKRRRAHSKVAHCCCCGGWAGGKGGRECHRFVLALPSANIIAVCVMNAELLTGKREWQPDDWIFVLWLQFCVHAIVRAACECFNSCYGIMFGWNCI